MKPEIKEEAVYELVKALRSTSADAKRVLLSMFGMALYAFTNGIGREDLIVLVKLLFCEPGNEERILSSAINERIKKEGSLDPANWMNSAMIANQHGEATQIAIWRCLSQWLENGDE